ncbi:PQQ-dependent sugar dehydrogenase [Sphingomonas montanisoli]|uniref:Cadherin domain-containing protein n=1 Tax=Sphingomonas montanisoli TaxID=2606412 RepID=A0A5D9C9K0_9SPHN|nr:PQQ-dependent sugar dehydrogenase [Sphingomonas montanisoli]TZG28003.1 cadherin domain-containing protein [Sphingomonas montanisoli]
MLRSYLLRASSIMASAALLASCGGDGGSGSGGGGGSPPANTAPVFTSPATLSVVENASGTIYTATATDADSNPLSYAISGGLDRSAFQISAGGALSFAASPDFEAPADSDRNNVYQVELSVSDGTTSTTLALTVTVTNDPNDSFRTRRVATGLGGAVFLAPVPDNSGRVFVVQRTGFIRILTPSTGAVAGAPFLDVSSQISTQGERGLLGFATAPDFATSGTFYIYLTNPGGTIELRRYQTQTGNRDVGDVNSGDVILSIPHPTFDNHNGGWIGFDANNLLYVAVGDGGGGGDPAGNAQNRNALLGKILRIDPRSDAFPADPNRNYTIPTGNPFAGGGGAGEVWALGLRNPFRNSFDPTTGNLYIADVGQDVIEEVNLMRPTDGGANFGWNRREGTQPYNGGTNDPIFTPPVTEYAHGTGEMQGDSITGGYVYRGPITSLRGLYFFADFVRSRIWSIPVAELVPGQTAPSSRFTLRNLAPNAGTIDNVTSFGLDQTGNLYIVGIDGEIFVIEPAA